MKFIKLGEIVYLNGLIDNVLEEVEDTEDDFNDFELLEEIAIISSEGESLSFLKDEPDFRKLSIHSQKKIPMT